MMEKSLDEQRLEWQKRYDQKYGIGKVPITIADVEEINRNLKNFFDWLIEADKKYNSDGKLLVKA
jgi:hypothetical protein